MDGCVTNGDRLVSSTTERPIAAGTPPVAPIVRMDPVTAVCPVIDEGPPGGAWLLVLLLADEEGRNDEAEETGAAVAGFLNTPLILLSSL
mmetsp:Transcript_15459/g.28070  ORF Transcript_15459/g.28070 Transcript_15459/m.28070 type:complete len:90 (+) Transcript_15459:1315-1584(+)